MHGAYWHENPIKSILTFQHPRPFVYKTRAIYKVFMNWCLSSRSSVRSAICSMVFLSLGNFLVCTGLKILNTTYKQDLMSFRISDKRITHCGWMHYAWLHPVRNRPWRIVTRPKTSEQPRSLQLVFRYLRERVVLLVYDIKTARSELSRVLR